jgi:hypothetical protein
MRADLGTLQGLQVASWPINLSPGAKVELSYRMEKVPGDLEDLQLRMTGG